jgi:hypothetical protein
VKVLSSKANRRLAAAKAKLLRRTTNLGAPEMHDYDIDGRQTNKDDVVTPFYFSEGCWSSFDIHQCRQESANHGPCDTLTTDVCGENFTWENNHYSHLSHWFVLTAVDVSHNVKTTTIERDKAEGEKDSHA